MKRVLLYNFTDYKLPDGLDEALSLLGLWTTYNHKERMWQIYQKAGQQRFPWAAQAFSGGDMDAWVKFLTVVCAVQRRA